MDVVWQLVATLLHVNCIVAQDPSQDEYHWQIFPSSNQPQWNQWLAYNTPEWTHDWNITSYHGGDVLYRLVSTSRWWVRWTWHTWERLVKQCRSKCDQWSDTDLGLRRRTYKLSRKLPWHAVTSNPKLLCKHSSILHEVQAPWLDSRCVLRCCVFGSVVQLNTPTEPLDSRRVSSMFTWNERHRLSAIYWQQWAEQ